MIADDLQMEALAQNFKPEETVELAINAGCDILIYHDLEEAREAMTVAREHLKAGRITEARVEESFARIQEVKKRVLSRFPYPDIEKMGAIVGCEAHREVLAAVLERKEEVASS